MACYQPIMVLPRGVVAKNGKSYEDNVHVGCGKCPDCRARRVQDWVVRMKEEDKVSVSTHFVTLTYNTDYVPISKNGFMTLRKRDVQLFFKRLRKLHKKQYPNAPPIKYYLCGEYGGERHRPHYHAIIFNAGDQCLYEKAWVSHEGGTDYLRGKVDIGYDASSATMAYTVKYMDKDSTTGRHERDDRLKEFSLMSKHIGSGYLTQAIKDYHRQDLERNYYSDYQFKRALPRYYRERIYTEEERAAQAQLIQQKVKEKEAEQLAYVSKNHTVSLTELRHDEYIAKKQRIKKQNIKRNNKEL